MQLLVWFRNFVLAFFLKLGQKALAENVHLHTANASSNTVVIAGLINKHRCERFNSCETSCIHTSCSKSLPAS